MTSSAAPARSAPTARAAAFAAIIAFVLVAFALPFFGVLLSLALPFLTHATRRHLWPQASAGMSMMWSGAAWVGLWFPGVMSIFGPFPAGVGAATGWLLIPLCGPVGTAAMVWPAAAAVGVSVVGLLGSRMMRSGWLWVGALWLAPWAYDAVLTAIGPAWIC